MRAFYKIFVVFWARHCKLTTKLKTVFFYFGCTKMVFSTICGLSRTGIRQFSTSRTLCSSSDVHVKTRTMHRLTHPGSNRPSYVSPEQAVKVVESGNRVFIHSVAAAPRLLIEAMVGRHKELRDVEVCHIHTEQPALYAEAKYRGSFRSNNFFCAKNIRPALSEGRAGYVPIFLSEVPKLFKQGICPIDVAMLQLSPPDKHGFCSMGPSVDVTVAAAESATHLIAQINPNVPRTHGDGLIHVSCLDAVVECNDPIPTLEEGSFSEIEGKIGKLVASLVEDGATLQMGIGTIPNAVLSSLKNHKHLGVHSEMIADGVIDLVHNGVIDNSKKKIQQHITSVGFVMGTKRIYEFIDDNPSVRFLRIEYINDPSVIRLNPKVTAINSAIEVDITGQVVADSIGSRIYSGVGGQVDFIRGAGLSEGGKPIIALPSVTSKGESRIVSFIKQGAGVVTSRAHVHYVVTEYGIANLFGANLQQRAKKLISIAHPDHREALEKAAYNDWFDMW
ncbi:4-hydroxybutyrate coenzyme A transferase-like [Schistocerca gregaria]|uniref:4-hydroxybutyrate coenzyme A transferase-like n=1 Tax=Schistocerca gregaria TaxID=7010 RepID=UPI00211E4CCD|nr:4-hydroxybutyrate coenzyme A transferase-like [Schistocerca gregaria]